MTNYTLAERIQYAPESFSSDELIDLLGELDAWRDMSDSESPEDVSSRINALEEQAGKCNDSDHSNFDDYKEFFDDCVRTVEDVGGRWPCAEPYDLNLRVYICDAITRGLEEGQE